MATTIIPPTATARTVRALAHRLRKLCRRAEQDVAFDLKAASNYLEAFAETLRRKPPPHGGGRDTTGQGGR
jgi:hypothetical protein